MNATTAAVHSVITNAHHTPVVPMALLSINAAGIITIIYLSNDMTSDGTPSPRASKVPEYVTENDETIKPRQIMRSAVQPLEIVSALLENSPISCDGTVKHATVPKIIAFLKIFFSFFERRLFNK